MSKFYQYPPTGGPAQPLPAGGLNLDFSFKGGRLSNVTIVVTAGSAVFQYINDKDTTIPPLTITAGNNYHEYNLKVQSFSLTGTATVAMVMNDPPGDVDPATLALGSSSIVSVVQDSIVVPGTPSSLLLTCPAGFKWTLVRATFLSISNGNFILYVDSLGTTNDSVDYITSKAGVAITPTQVVVIGNGGGNDIVLGQPVVLYSGDKLRGSGGGTLAYQFQQEPQ